MPYESAVQHTVSGTINTCSERKHRVSDWLQPLHVSLHLKPFIAVPKRMPCRRFFDSVIKLAQIFHSGISCMQKSSPLPTPLLRIHSYQGIIFSSPGYVRI